MGLMNNQTKKSKYVKVLLFIFCALPGLGLFLASTGLLFAAFYDPRPNVPEPIITMTTSVIGMVLMLIGIGKLQKWAYLFVFLAIPVSTFIYMLFDSQAKGGLLGLAIFVLIVSFAVLYFVKRFYQGRNEGKS